MTHFYEFVHPLNRDSGAVFEFKKLFGTHGPDTINGRRLDELATVEVLLDSSTSVMTETGLAHTTSSASGVLGRAAVGAIVAGGAGAVIGGATGQKTTSTTSTRVEIRNTNLTVRLTFEDGHSLPAVITDERAYHWLLELASAPALTAHELDLAKASAQEAQKERQLESQAEQYLTKPVFNPVHPVGPVAGFVIASALVYVWLVPAGLLPFMATLMLSLVGCFLIAGHISSRNTDKLAEAFRIYELERAHVIEDLKKGITPRSWKRPM